MRDALIIFVKNTEFGKVKTRLAKSVGNEEAMEIYRDLLKHTREIAASVDVDRFVYYSSYIPEEDQLWDKKDFEYRVQEGDDLGARMDKAFNEIFDEDYERSVIIGSDCLDLTREILEKAYEELNEADVVIGPARDGGYYLLGMSECYSGLFKNKKWSSNTVFDDTIDDMIRLGLIWYELPMLSDIDTLEDLQRARFVARQKSYRDN